MWKKRTGIVAQEPTARHQIGPLLPAVRVAHAVLAGLLAERSDLTFVPAHVRWPEHRDEAADAGVIDEASADARAWAAV